MDDSQDSATVVPAVPPSQRQWTDKLTAPWLISWTLLGAFVVRQFVLAFLLEPTTDEGLWLWNARCEAWNLPDYGILHAAISPVNYWLSKGLFMIVNPAILPVRLTNVLVLGGALAWWIGARSCEKEETSGPLLLTALLVDPFVFRAASWAYIEPKLLAMLLVAMILSKRTPCCSTAVFLGTIFGIALATKATMAWVPALAIPLFLRRDIRHLAILSWSVAAVVALLLYASVYLTHDPGRFADVWSRLGEGQISPGAGYFGILRRLDPRPLLYLVTIATAVVVSIRAGLKSQLLPMHCAVLAGFLYFLPQSHVQDRYLMPLAAVSLLAICDAMPVPHRFPSATALVGLIFISAVSTLLFRAFVRSPANSGGRPMQDLVVDAAKLGLSIAAPPCLSIEVNHPVVPTSVGENLGNPPPAEFFPAVLVRQVVAAWPTSEDSRFEKHLKEMDAAAITSGTFYRAESTRRDLLDSWAATHPAAIR